MDNEGLDIRRLLAFRSLAATGSFTHTAKALCLTQSAISHSIRALEGDLGCALFHRVSKKAHLTQAGEVFLERVHGIFSAMESARSAVKALTRWGKGRLRIGASVTACRYVLPGVLREFRECFPEYDLAVDSQDTPESLEALRENRIDFAITLRPEDLRPFQFRELFEDQLYLVTSPAHRWGRASSFPNAAEWESEPLIVYSRRSYTFRMIESYFRVDGVTLRNTMELGSMEAIKDLVKIGVGVSLLSSWIVQREVDGDALLIRSIGPRPLTRTWGVTLLKDRKPNLAEETFIGLCESACQSLAKPE